MADDDVWTRLRRQRLAAADYFDTVTPDEWQQPSLCAGWSNRDVLAHLTAGSRGTMGGFIAGMVKARFDFHRFIAGRLAAEDGKQPPELLADFRRLAGAKNQPGKAMIGEAIVHAEDVRRSVGRGTIHHDPDDVRLVAGYYQKGGGPIGVKKRIAGVRLEATDSDFATGDGLLASGPTLAVVMAMCGRQHALDELTGPGVDVLRSR